MSSLNWTPVTEHPDGPPRYLEALTSTGARFEIRPIYNSDNPIEGWSLTFYPTNSDQKADNLGRFDDTVSAQLHAQQHHDNTPP